MIKHRVDAIKFAINSALNLEPYLYKKGAVNMDENLGDKKFEEFVMCSSVCCPIFNEYIDDYVKFGKKIHPYEYLYKMVKSSIELFDKVRMWGAIELLLPLVKYRLVDDCGLHNNFYYNLDCIKEVDVMFLDKAREITWSKSDKQFKKNYKPVGGLLISTHYVMLLNLGKNINEPTIITWCEDIINGLRIAGDIYDNIKHTNINELHTTISKIWSELIHIYTNRKIGQIADYTVLALFEYFYNYYFRFGEHIAD